MQLFIKTELEANSLATGVHKGFCSGQEPAGNFDVESANVFIGYLIPPNIGELVLYRNLGAFFVQEMAAWPYYVQIENLSVLSQQQEEMVWVQLKMSGGFLGARKIASEVKAVKTH